MSERAARGDRHPGRDTLDQLVVRRTRPAGRRGHRLHLHALQGRRADPTGGAALSERGFAPHRPARRAQSEPAIADPARHLLVPDPTTERRLPGVHRVGKVISGMRDRQTRLRAPHPRPLRPHARPRGSLGRRPRLPAGPGSSSANTPRSCSGLLACRPVIETGRRHGQPEAHFRHRILVGGLRFLGVDVFVLARYRCSRGK